MSFSSWTWWRNLLGGQAGELLHRGKTFPVTARIIDQPGEVRDGLKAYFDRYPEYAKYFGIRRDERGVIPEADLAHAANDRVIIRLIPG